ncbi:MAG: class I SAM-dependent methyltransferase [Actinobacteria bacterium]|nr:class I SAM-dependent methyltransferase [Actinomycetota bacterium]
MSERNIEVWTRANADYTDARAEEAWLQGEIEWGIWHVPERELQALPDVAGKDVVELGCGTAYFGAWLKRRGARRVVGVDPTPAQLATARRCVERTGIELELVEAFGEDVPLPDESFDVALSEYGASIWADPYKWIPEAARLLRPGGELVFLRNSTLVILCSPDDGQVEERLLRPQFGMHRFEWAGGVDDGVEYHLSHGDWIRVLRENGFEILDLIEIQAPAEAETHAQYDFVTADWARKWPSEEIWRARKRG